MVVCCNLTQTGIPKWWYYINSNAWKKRKTCTKNRLHPANIQNAVANIVFEYPAYEQEHTTNELHKR